MNNKKWLFFSSNLLTNFKPNPSNYSYNFRIKKNKIRQIFCKNFIIYLLLLKKRSSFFDKSSIFVKKLNKKVYTILKAPYRYKIARHQICINRYNLNFSTKINLNRIVKIQSWSNLTKLFKFLKSFEKIFESNIMYINSLKFNFPLIYKNNFVFKNFKKKIKNK